jgi:Flp pilus assembly protein TadG
MGPAGLVRRAHRVRRDEGSAIIEFIFVAVLIMVPLVYFIVAVASVQAGQLAVTNAAREAGRAFATADSVDEGLARAQAAARIAFADNGLHDAGLLRFVAPGQSCAAGPVSPTLNPGAEFTVCVRRESSLPAIPTLLQGKGITTEGRYALHIDDYRPPTAGSR